MIVARFAWNIQGRHWIWSSGSSAAALMDVDVQNILSRYPKRMSSCFLIHHETLWAQVHSPHRLPIFIFAILGWPTFGISMFISNTLGLRLPRSAGNLQVKNLAVSPISSTCRWDEWSFLPILRDFGIICCQSCPHGLPLLTAILTSKPSLVCKSSFRTYRC